MSDRARAGVCSSERWRGWVVDGDRWCDMTQLESAIWRIADGRGNDDDVALLRDGGATSLSLLARLIGEAEDGLASARDLPGDEREHVVADFTDTVESLRTTADLLRPAKARRARTTAG